MLFCPLLCSPFIFVIILLFFSSFFTTHSYSSSSSSPPPRHLHPYYCSFSYHFQSPFKKCALSLYAVFIFKWYFNSSFKEQHFANATCILSACMHNLLNPLPTHSRNLEMSTYLVIRLVDNEKGYGILRKRCSLFILSFFNCFLTYSHMSHLHQFIVPLFPSLSALFTSVLYLSTFLLCQFCKLSLCRRTSSFRE